MRFKLFVCFVIIFCLFPLLPVQAENIAEDSEMEMASVSFGPVRAIRRTIDDLDDIANKHWQGLWNDASCSSPDSDPTNYSCEGADPGFPMKVLRYWANNPSDQPTDFAAAVMTGSEPEKKEYETLSKQSYVWKYQTGGAVSSLAAVNYQENIYVTSHDGNIYSFKYDGTRRDEFSVDYLDDNSLSVGPIYAAPAIDAFNNIYVGSQGGKFFSIEADTGFLNWVSEYIDDWIISSAAVGPDNTIYVGANNGNLYAFDYNASSPRWVYNASDAAITASPAIGGSPGDTIVYFPSRDGKLYALRDGGSFWDLQWTYNTNNVIKSSPAIDAQGVIYFGDDAGWLHAVNPDGSNRWAFKTGDAITSSPAIGSDSTVYVASWDGKIYALDHESGDKKWSFTTGERITSSPLVGRASGKDIIYFGSDDKHLYAISDTGAGLWRMETEREISSSPALINDRIIIGDNAGYVYAASAGVTQLAASSWPKFRRDKNNAGSVLRPEFAPWTGPEWYVNSDTTQGGIFTNAPGDDNNTGGPDDPFRTVARALETAVSGATLIIDVGTYTEQVRIDTRSLTFIGAGPDSTVFDGSELGDSAVGFYADNYSNITLEEIGIANYERGIDFNGVQQARFDTLTIQNTTGAGIKLVLSPETILKNIEVLNSSSGIYINNSDSISISSIAANNNSGFGISVNNSNYLSFADISSSENDSAGIAVNNSDSVTVTNSTADTNAVGIHIDSTGDLALNGLTVQGNNSIGIKIETSTFVTIANADILNNTDTGIEILAVTGGEITGNTISGNLSGIAVASGEFNISSNEILNSTTSAGLILTTIENSSIYSNLISGNQTGIILNGGLSNRIYQNELKGNSDYQITLEASTGSIIEKNNIRADSGVLDITGDHNFTSNWWNSSDEIIINNRLTNSDSFIPFRLGEVDTNPVGDSIAPLSPQDVETIPKSYYSIINWQEVTENEDGSTLTEAEFGGYRIYRTTHDTETDWKQKAVLIATIDTKSTTTFVDTNPLNPLDNNETYYYRITAVDNHSPENESYFSDSATVTPYHQGPIWYVNDDGPDSYFTTAAGYDTNTGGPRDPFRTITHALQFMSQGDTIKIDIGTYSEEVVIDSPDSHNFLTITGAEIYRDTTIIESPTNDGLNIENINNIKIKNLTVASNIRALALSNVENSLIKNLKTTDNRIRLRNSSNNNILNNYIEGDKLRLEGSSDNFIKNNKIKNNTGGSGFDLDEESSNNTLRANMSINNDPAGFRISGNSNNNKLEYNITSKNDWGIRCDDSSGGTISYNIIKENASRGIYFDDANTWTVKYNLINTNDIGLELTNNSSDIFIHKNKFQENENYQLYFSENAHNPIIGINNFVFDSSAHDLIHSDITAETVDITYNWLSITDKNNIANNLSGIGGDSIIYIPFRLGIADTGANQNVAIPDVSQSQIEFSADTAVSDTVAYAELNWSPTERWIERGFEPDEVPDIIGYNIYRSQDPGESDWKKVAYLDSTTTASYDDFTVNRADTYYYRITAVDFYNTNYENESWFSETKKVVMPPAKIGITQPDSGLITNADSITVSGNAELAVEYDSMQIFVNNDLLDSFVVGSPADSWAIDITPVSDTVNNIRVEIYRDGPGQYIMDADSITIYVDHTAPDTPVLLRPADNLDTHPRNFEFAWEETFDTFLADRVKVDTYEFQLSYDSLFITPADTEITGDTAVSRDLHGDTEYFWRVRAFDTAGNISEWSDTSSLFVYNELQFDTTTLSVGDGTDTLYYDDLNGDSSLYHDSAHTFKIVVENADTVTLYYNVEGIPADSSDSSHPLGLNGDTWILEETLSDTEGDTINFILKGIDAIGDTHIIDNDENGFEYWVSYLLPEQINGWHSPHEKNMPGIPPRKTDILYYSARQNPVV